jgi:UDP-glucose 4-epimerase
VRVLVAGGAGFIGSVTADALLTGGHDVTVVDDLSAGHRDAVPSQAAFVKADVTDPASVEPIIADGGFDACVHFAALIEAGESMRAPERFFSVNTAGTARLLEVLLGHGVGRFVLSSTAAVYGEPGSTPITEDATLAPTNPYGESKLLVERMLAWHHQVHGLKVAALRYFNAAGAAGPPERHHPETHLIPLVLRVAAGQRTHIDVYGTDYPTADGTAVRDYVHVRDLADAHVRALERIDELGTVTCNLGNGKGSSVREVIEAARRVTGQPIPARESPRRQGDPAVLVASAERASALLGWSPQRHDLDLMVADAWKAMCAAG